jgi:hypothetical protein
MSEQPNTIMRPVKGSSTVKALGYVETTETLIVEFHSGGTYVHDGVPLDLSDKFAQAESYGKFYAAHIRGKFATMKLPNPALHELPAINPLAAG